MSGSKKSRRFDGERAYERMMNRRLLAAVFLWGALGATLITLGLGRTVWKWTAMLPGVGEIAIVIARVLTEEAAKALFVVAIPALLGYPLRGSELSLGVTLLLGALVGCGFATTESLSSVILEGIGGDGLFFWLFERINLALLHASSTALVSTAFLFPRELEPDMAVLLACGGVTFHLFHNLMGGRTMTGLGAIVFVMAIWVAWRDQNSAKGSDMEAL